MITTKEPGGEKLDGILIKMPRNLRITEEQFFRLCAANDGLRIERDANGDLTIMEPAGGGTGARNLGIGAQLWNWAQRDGTGVGFDSSTGFLPPGGEERSPDASWVLRSRLAGLPPAQKEKFLPLCPDFVVELRSPSDSRAALERKMEGYLASGARLGWLIDPIGGSNTVTVYRPGQDAQTLTSPLAVSGDPELPGFILDLSAVWTPPF